jgi:hypothetical protein
MAHSPLPDAGEELLEAVAPPEDPSTPSDPSNAQMTNARALRQPALSAAFEAAARNQLAAATRDDLSHAAAKVTALLQITDPAHFAARAKEVLADWDAVTANTLLVPAAADTLEAAAVTAYAAGLQRPAEMANDRGNWGHAGRPGQVGGSAPGGGGSAKQKIKDVLSGKLDEAVLDKVHPDVAAKIKAIKTMYKETKTK